MIALPQIQVTWDIMTARNKTGKKITTSCRAVSRQIKALDRGSRSRWRSFGEESAIEGGLRDDLSFIALHFGADSQEDMVRDADVQPL